MDIFILYLLTRLDSIAFALNLCAIAAGITAITSLIVEERLTVLVKKALAVAVSLLTLTVLTPTSKDMAIIIAGHYAYEGVTSEQFTGTAKKVFDLVNRELDEALAEPKE